ncbi:MAG: hypothetical protein KA855_08885 [Zoogloea sp.]|nr:hypothetical protein [Zoogloea sp.]
MNTPQPHDSATMADDDPGVQARRQQRIAALLLSRYNLRYMVRLYAAFEGDLLLPIVLGEVGLYNVSGLGLDDQSLAAIRCSDDGFGKLPLRPCNAFSISSSTGIPRETVRRKVSHLIQLGWIARDMKGGLTITAKAANLCLEPFDQDNLADFLSTADRVRLIAGPSQDPSTVR